jgi:sarcosine oxidase, subunit alpha
MDLRGALQGGAAAARAALQALGADATPSLQDADVAVPVTRALEPQWFTPGAAPEYQWLDFQYDVTVADIALAARENFVSVEHVKRYTTNGMSVDQGKTSNVNALAVLADRTGRAIPEVGTTRFRPPYHPVTMGAIAGRAIGDRYAPRLESPIHERHLDLGAEMDDYGGWQRPACYLQPGEDEHQAVRREMRAVRNGLALFDGSPLGKIEVRGPDAAEFLERIYINSVRNLSPGRARYGLMLNELGIVIDDGVLVRLAEDHFLVHTTSGGASRIFLMLEEWLQCEWTTLRVRCANVTTQWATVTLSGRNARDMLPPLIDGIDFSRDAFPHMQFRTGRFGDVPARVLRASFTGEASYEISVPANRGLALWDAIHSAGAPRGIAVFGLEALLMLRVEKGYLHVGADTDGTTNPLDLGWGPVIAKKQSDFIGRRSLSQPEALRTGRFRFCGIEPLDPAKALPIGAHVLDTLSDGRRRSGGYVTSSCFSATLGRWIGLGIVRDGPDREGEIVTVVGNGIEMQARLRGPVYLDPEGERLHG